MVMPIPDGYHLLEKNKRLSKSLLWELEYNAYIQLGPTAWTKEGVPFYINSNPYHSFQCAQLYLGFLRDHFRSKEYNSTETLYILELGSGTGRFGYLFIKDLCKILEDFSHSEIKICYILSDIVQKNIDFWMNHPLLKPYVEKGLLDFSLFNGLVDSSIQLIHSGKLINKNSLTNPLTVICTYLFDSIAHDLFKVENGKLFEGRVNLYTNVEKAAQTDQIQLIKNLHVEYEWKLIESPRNYYEDSVLNKVIIEYMQELTNTEFLIPIGGIQCINNLLGLAKGDMFFLTSDKGTTSVESIIKHTQPSPIFHHTFSFQVNFNAIEKYFKHTNSCIIFPQNPTFELLTIALCFRKEQTDCFESILAYRSHIDLFPMYQFWEMTNQVLAQDASPSIGFIVSLMQLSHWDPCILQIFIKYLNKYGSQASENEKNQIETMVDKVWGNYFQIGPNESTFICSIGLLFMEMERFEKALLYYERALDICSTDCSTLFCIALFYYKMGSHSAANKCLQVIANIDPDFSEKINQQMTKGLQA